MACKAMVKACVKQLTWDIQYTINGIEKSYLLLMVNYE